MGREWLEGLRVVRAERMISNLFIVMGLLVVAEGMIDVMLVVFVREVLHGDSQVFGWVVSARGVGGIIGGLVIARMGRKMRPAPLLTISVAAVGFLLLVVVNFPVLLLTLFLFVLTGLFVVGMIVATSTLLQRSVPVEYRGRVFATYGTSQSLLILLGIGIATTWGNDLGALTLLDAAAILYILSGITAFLLLCRSKDTSQLHRSPQSELLEPADEEWIP